MLLLAPVIGLLPDTTLAAIVIVYSIGLIKPAEFQGILGVRRLEFVWALVAFAGVEERPTPDRFLLRLLDGFVYPLND